MLILLLLVMLAPAMLSVVLYERFKGVVLSVLNRIIAIFIFAFIINLISYSFVWLRGWEHISWALNGTSTLLSVPFCVKYMAVSLVAAVIIAFILNLVQVGKRK